MNYQTRGYLLPPVLGGTLVTLAAVLFGLQRALMLDQWSIRDRGQAVSVATILLVGWFFAALFWRWGAFRRVIDSIPQPWIVGVQLFRVEGVIFLTLYALYGLPGAFAWPAGVGDVIVGLLAPAVGFAYAYSPTRAAGLLRAWNLLGIGDLIVAGATGFLTSPSRFQVLALDSPNVLITAFPLAMIPVFLVPLAVLLHLASLQKLRQSETGPRLSHQLLARERS